MGLEGGIFQSVGFEITQKKVSIREGHFGTHGGAMDLKVVVIIKRKIIHGENHANEVTECARVSREFTYLRIDFRKLFQKYSYSPFRNFLNFWLSENCLGEFLGLQLVIR